MEKIIFDMKCDLAILSNETEFVGCSLLLKRAHLPAADKTFQVVTEQQSGAVSMTVIKTLTTSKEKKEETSWRIAAKAQLVCCLIRHNC